MGQRCVPVLIAAVLLGLLIPTLARPVVACSAGPDFNPVAGSDLIVAGRITGWELAAPVLVSPPPPDLANAAMHITMQVDHVRKGSAPPRVTFLDFGSPRAAELARVRYPGLSVGVGGCPVFESDPTGLYAVLGLVRAEGGRYQANRLLTFYAGDAPAGPAYDRALAELASLGPARLPVTGTSLGADRGTDARSLVVLVLLAAGGARALRRYHGQHRQACGVPEHVG